MNKYQRLALLHQMTEPANVNGNAPQLLDDCLAVAGRPAAYVENRVLPKYVEVVAVGEADKRRKVGLLILHVLNR